MINQEIIAWLAIFGAIVIYLFVGWLMYIYINWLNGNDYDDVDFSGRFVMYCFAIIALPIAIIMTLFLIIKKIIEIPSQLDNIEDELKKLSAAKRSKIK